MDPKFFRKYADIINEAEQVSEGYYTSDNWETVEEIKSTSGNILGLVILDTNGSYGYYDERKAHAEFGFSSANEARQAFVDYFNARKK